MLLVWALSTGGALTLGACAAQTTSGAPPRPIELPVQPEQEPPAAAATAPAATATEPPVPAPPAEKLPPLPASWSAPPKEVVPYAKALAAARDGRRAFESESFDGDGGVPSPERYERANSLLETTSRRFAAAYHAPDVTEDGRIAALYDAADLVLAWARRLDEAGLARAPSGYRTSSKVALTFEDVVVGPAKRWREEGLALVRLCVDKAKSTKSTTMAARECAALRERYARVLQASSAARSDAGATGCACDPGDPLCSSSMNGWCRR